MEHRTAPAATGSGSSLRDEQEGLVSEHRCIHELSAEQCSTCRPAAQVRRGTPTPASGLDEDGLSAKGRKALAALRAQHRSFLRGDPKATRRVHAKAVAAALALLPREERRRVQRRSAQISATNSENARDRAREDRLAGLHTGPTIPQNVGRGQRQR